MLDTLEVSVQNVQALPLMPQKHVEEDVKAVSRISDLVLWQEIKNARYRKAVRDLPDDTWNHVMLKGLGYIGGCPISYRKDELKLIQKGKKFGCIGVPGIGPVKFFVWAEFVHIESGAPIFVVNWHYPASAWSKKVKPMRKLRQKLWRKMNKRGINLIAEWVREGYVVVAGGDSNRMFHDTLGGVIHDQEVVYVTKASAIEELAFIESDEYNVILMNSESFPRHSDHVTRYGALKLMKKAKR